MSLPPFRFFDLPQELQDKVYALHFEGVHALVAKPYKGTRDRTSRNRPQPPPDSPHARIAFGEWSSLAIEQTCRKANTDARVVRSRSWSLSLILQAPHNYGNITDVLCKSPRYEWLRNNVESLIIEDADRVFFAPSVSIPSCLPRLRSIEFHATSEEHNRRAIPPTVLVHVSDNGKWANIHQFYLSGAPILPCIETLHARLGHRFDVRVNYRFFLNMAEAQVMVRLVWNSESASWDATFDDTELIGRLRRLHTP